MGTEEEDETNMQGCCNKLSICLAVVVILLVLIIVFGACVFFFGFSALGFSEAQKECTNSACVKASALISDFVDDTVDPCADFYSFVCGKFEKVAYEKQIANLLISETERVQRQLDAYIVEPLHPDDPKHVKMQKTYFRACLNEDGTDVLEQQILIRKLLEIADWPLAHKLTSWEENNFEWTDVMIKARQMGLPFEWFLKVDLFSSDNTEKYDLMLSVPENCGEKLTDKYFAMQRDILEMFIRPGIDTYSDFTRLAHFERLLGQLCVNTTENHDLYEITHLRFDNVTTPRFLKDLTGLSFRWRLKSQVAYNPKYVFYLNRFLQQQKKEQANYIFWKIIQYFAPYLTKPVRERYAEYLQETSGKDTSRFDFCLEDTKSRFKYVSEIFKIQQYAESSIEENGEEMIDSIKEQIVEYIKSVEWKSNKTKESHLNFFDNLENVIGGPQEMFEEDFLENYLPVGNLAFGLNNIIHLIIEWSQTTFESKMKMIGRPKSMDLGYVYDSTSNSLILLDDDEQQLIVPAAALDGFLYDPDLPKYFNYAGLGTVLGHELIHVLKPLGTDKHQMYKGFEENQKCFINSFHKSYKHLNSSLLFIINYKWLMAQEFAYRAYQTYVANNEEESQVVNLPYSPNQLFWIRSSLKWCYHNLPEEKNRHMQEVYKIRILESVKHSRDFATDFNCTLDAHMNPTNKCPLL